MDIFTRNIPTLTETQQEALREKTVFVAGCGGLGGYIIEYLVRLGVGGIRACDGDTFAESNLNRQILAVGETIGKSKVATARQRALSINPEVRFSAIDGFLDASNADELLSGCDAAMDALDNGASRIILAEASSRAGIPMIHGAVGGERIQVSTVMPQDTFFSALYRNYEEPEMKSTLSFVPAACAALQVSEVLKILIGEEPALSGRLLCGDLALMRFDHIDFR